MSYTTQPFDWSSMIYEVFNKDKPTSLASSQNTSISTSPSFSALQFPKKECLQSPLTTVNEEIWLDDLLSDDQVFSSNLQTRKNSINTDLSNSMFTNDEFSSATTSFTNTPMIKLENELQDLPNFISLENKSEELTRNSSIDSMFKEIFTDIEDNEEKPQPKQRKKRAPRKRLTDHQKQAHNKIEKRYRININAKIAGLQKIIPWVSGEKTAFEIGDELNDKKELDNIPRMNKSMILDKLTMYILHLQENEIKLKFENELLKKKLNSLNCK